MASIDPRKTNDGKTTYRVRVRMKGYPMQTATFTRLTDAKKWAQQTEAAIREGRHFKKSESKRHTLAEAIDRYCQHVLPSKPRSQKNQSIQLQCWKRRIGDYLLFDITPALIAEHRDCLVNEKTHQNKDRSPATVNRYLAALSHLFSVAMKEWGWIEDNPMNKVSKLTEARGRVRFLDDDERERLLSACKESENNYLYLVVVLCLSTGARRMEILGLTWKDADLRNERIFLHDTKNKERRTLPLKRACA